MTYTPPRYITLENLQDRFGKAAVSQLLDHDGDSEPDTEKVIAIIEEASGAADAILYAAFTPSVIEKVREDSRFRSAVCDIAMSLAGEQKQEFGAGEGKPPYAGHRKRGEEMLRLIAKGQERLAAEATHGQNATIRQRTSVSLPHTHLFAASRANPKGPGGF